MNELLKEKLWREFPVLESNRLILRKMKNQTDIDDLLQIWGDPQVCKYTDFNPFDTPEKIQEILQIVHQGFKNRERIRWGICLKSVNRIMGTIGFNSWKIHRTNCGEIGYDLAQDYWNQGIITEAIIRVVDYGFNQMQLHRIEATVDPANHASQKVLIKTGFKKEGLLRDYAFFKGQFHSLLMFSRLNSDS